VPYSTFLFFDTPIVSADILCLNSTKSYNVVDLDLTSACPFSGGLKFPKCSAVSEKSYSRSKNVANKNDIH
jgi:hypothetical protein